MAIAISADQVLVDIRNWYYRLRMVQAHLETSAVSGMTPRQLDFCVDTVNDLLGACEDASSFIASEVLRVAPVEEEGVGEGFRDPRGRGE